MKIPRENAYICPKGHVTMTVDVADGVTPMFLGCRDLGCREIAQSRMYPRQPRPENFPAPKWEWYRPTQKQAERKEHKYPGTLDHVKNGGLLLRERTGAEPVYHPEEVV
jgi:hypothetical protein